MQSELIILQILHLHALPHIEVPLGKDVFLNFCGPKTPQIAHYTGSDAKSSRLRQWLPIPYHVWGNFTHDSLTAKNHKP